MDALFSVAIIVPRIEPTWRNSSSAFVSCMQGVLVLMNARHVSVKVILQFCLARENAQLFNYDSYSSEEAKLQLYITCQIIHGIKWIRFIQSGRLLFTSRCHPVSLKIFAPCRNVDFSLSIFLHRDFSLPGIFAITWHSDVFPSRS